jgi:hypothetical protein
MVQPQEGEREAIRKLNVHSDKGRMGLKI